MESVVVPFTRIQSPSSINVYKQCPRKYYYQYIVKLPTKPSIHLTRGTIVHSVIENFFKLDPKVLNDKTYDYVLKIFIHDLLRQYWEKKHAEFSRLNLDKTILDFYLLETKQMINGWIHSFLAKLEQECKSGMDVSCAFIKHTPTTEKRYESKKHGVMGFIDAIHEIDGKVILLDYKTSNKKEITDAYKLQLSIYALMFNEIHDRMPHKVGIHFLKFGEEYLEVTEDLIKFAQLESELIHMNTQSKEKSDYPLKPSPLCKWSSGECDYYHHCFGKGKESE